MNLERRIAINRDAVVAATPTLKISSQEKTELASARSTRAMENTDQLYRC